MKIDLLATFSPRVCVFLPEIHRRESVTNDHEFVFFYVGVVINSIELFLLGVLIDILFLDFQVKKLLNQCQ